MGYSAWGLTEWGMAERLSTHSINSEVGLVTSRKDKETFFTSVILSCRSLNSFKQKLSSWHKVGLEMEGWQLPPPQLNSRLLSYPVVLLLFSC